MFIEHLANIVQNTEYVVPEDGAEELQRAALSLRSLTSAHPPGVFTKAIMLIKHKHVLGARQDIQRIRKTNAGCSLQISVYKYLYRYE